MKNILSATHRPVLAEFARSNVVLAFDYDGTLAPIVADPDRAFMRVETRRLLAEAARLYPTIVISGRAQPDALRKLRGVGVYEVIGNHGLEPHYATELMIGRVRGWLALLETALGGLAGVEIEDKIFSVAVHYRRSADKRRARAEIARSVALLDDARVVGGKQVVNVVPRVAAHKGTALERARARLLRDTAIYVGDDETDEDVFAMERSASVLGIRVGAKRTSAAEYYLPRQTAIDQLLRELVHLRRPDEGASSRPRVA